MFDIWPKQKSKGFIEIYLCGWDQEYPDYGMFAWSTSMDGQTDYDIEVIDYNCIDLVDALTDSFDYYSK